MLDHSNKVSLTNRTSRHPWSWNLCCLLFFLWNPQTSKYLLRRCFRYVFGVQSYRTSGGGPGCLGNSHHPVKHRSFVQPTCWTDDFYGTSRISQDILSNLWKHLGIWIFVWLGDASYKKKTPRFPIPIPSDSQSAWRLGMAAGACLGQRCAGAQKKTTTETTAHLKVANDNNVGWYWTFGGLNLFS